MDAPERAEHAHSLANQIGSQRGQPIVMAAGVPVIDPNGAAIDIADLRSGRVGTPAWAGEQHRDCRNAIDRDAAAARAPRAATLPSYRRAA